MPEPERYGTKEGRTSRLTRDRSGLRTPPASCPALTEPDKLAEPGPRLISATRWERSRAIGARVLAVATGHFTVDQLNEHKPDWSVKSLAEIPAGEAVK